MSHKLKIGELQEQYLTDEEIWRIFTVVLSNRSAKSSTYKFALIKSLIENLYLVNDDFELTYDQIAYSFTKIYWNLVVQHDLIQHNNNPKKNARVATLMKEYQQQYSIPSEFIWDKIDTNIQIKLVRKVKSIMKENVFGALYGDTRGKFYAFDHRQEYFKINPAVHAFMLNYQRLIVNLTNYHMAAMIETLNEVPSINYLLGKVESIARRSSLSSFENILLNYFEAKCFYCEKPLTGAKRETHVDHFIPWSFVQSDNIWNLVLSCNRCNISKSDKLPEKQYLEFIIDRNNVLTEKKEDKNISSLMINYRPKKIIMLYDYSIRNGYDTIWIP
ncbi:HNH endonuclease [Sutcliffiella sp. NC1]|uniref:HNH endonuclease n=1 Tax=Sutcliffiella sp. NC1 TaxID=3004096 RepID=UPI0022DE2A3A|nr:HNH endonuclease domain-containing protein [Sutcliffiella sp. NC1]WBL16886.1 HNH endonuclease [Sutcliffiella sp. NC1]